MSGLQSAHTVSYAVPNVNVKGEHIKAVEHFTLLGSTLTQEGNRDIDVNN